jgi:hypothetical protein
MFMACRMQISQLKSFGHWLDDNVARIVRWAAFIGLVAALMSLVASYITPIYQYGWGAVVYSGVGAACIVTLAISGILVAWRYFNPILDQPAKPITQISGATDQAKAQEAPIGPTDLQIIIGNGTNYETTESDNKNRVTKSVLVGVKKP